MLKLLKKLSWSVFRKDFFKKDKRPPGQAPGVGPRVPSCTSASGVRVLRARSTHEAAGLGVARPSRGGISGQLHWHLRRGRCPLSPRVGRGASCALRASPAEAADRGQEKGVPRDSGAALRARSGLSHDLGAGKPWKETDPNFLPLELKQNLKARGYPHCQRWRLGGGTARTACPRGSQARALFLPSCRVSYFAKAAFT